MENTPHLAQHAGSLDPDDAAGPDSPAPSPAASPEPQRWISVVFFQGADADEVLDLIDRQGTDAAFTDLCRYDYGEETVQAALENGYVYDDLPTGTIDQVAHRDVYTLTYNHHLGHVHLLREYDALPDPVLLGIEDPTPQQDAPEHTPERAPEPRYTGPGREADRDWFAPPPTSGPGGSGGLGRGLSL